ncbi:ABC transporter substrate-binding protein [Polynucleobacter sp. MWH-UH24A]|uniref:heme/hemin ABC transporter substrate-binding protein n=1 Tax=Polynucleobacter sp. MWH-UH24A TaxID=2689110 RepID=UPI001BFE636D|nr:ABC transporter substrate-binding protein [Polynucleobacter sp. MWH-UH24A]QWD76811.1 ABC transporter substrate-binding protein [Polynucleobacter sp. MWH-UH24A]
MSDLCHTGRRRALCTIATIPVAWFGKSTWAARTQSISSRQRLICIGSAVTEIVYALEANDLIVGVDTTSIYPDAARSLPSIGYSRTLSAEGVLSLSPSQILCTEDAGPPVVLQQIQDAGIRIQRIPAHHTFTGVCDRVIAIGQAIHQPTRADQLKFQLQQQWARIEDAMKAKPFPSAAPRVLYIHSMNPSQVMVSGQETNANAMIRYAGLRNAMDGFRGYKPLTPEAVIVANPDLILVTDQGLQAIGGRSQLARLPGMERTKAILSQKVISMDAVYLLGFGPRMPEAVITLYRQARALFG